MCRFRDTLLGVHAFGTMNKRPHQFCVLSDCPPELSWGELEEEEEVVPGVSRGTVVLCAQSSCSDCILGSLGIDPVLGQDGP